MTGGSGSNAGKINLQGGTVQFVQAITNGAPDGNQHPYVGLLIFTDGEVGSLLRRGIMIGFTTAPTAS